MEQLDEALGRLLNDPGAMAQVMQLAQSLGASAPQQTEPAEPPGQELMQLLAPVRTDERQAALFRALGAYLSPKRREKLEKAVQLSRLSGLLKAMLRQNDPDDGRAI